MRWMVKAVAKCGLYSWASEIEVGMAEAKPVRTLNVRRLIIFLIIVVLISLLGAHVVSITGIWNTILLQPMLNFLVLMSRYFLGNFGIAIIVLTIILRLLMFPLTMRQLKSSKALQAIQPELKELQKKYAKDQQRLGQEIMKLYKEHGINPLGCFLPTLVQLPIWIALYQSVVQALAYTPENLFGLARQLYSPSMLQNTVPLTHRFLWLNLTHGDVVMVFLVGGSMWILTKMASPPSADRQQQSINLIMTWGLPLIFALFAFALPSGLSIYWVASNFIGIILQYRVTGWGSLRMPSLPLLKRGAPQPGGNRSTTTKGTAGTAKKAAKDIALPKTGPEADSASSGKKYEVGGNTGSPGKKIGDEDDRGEHV
jgi:YidC/Oxa1 family membrane protein insertase